MTDETYAPTTPDIDDPSYGWGDGKVIDERGWNENDRQDEEN